MIAAWCFQCSLDYTADVAECVECGVPTVEHPPSGLDEILSGDQPQLAYELHGWNGEARAVVENRLYGANVLHGWQGPTLLVLEADEDTVDALMEEIDQSMATSATASSSETAGGRVGFDLGARNQHLLAAVAARLTGEEIEHELMDNGFLLVDNEHEDAVGDWIEQIQEKLRGTGTFGDGVEGVSAHDVVESLFLSSDRLRRNTRDLRAQRELLDAETIARDLKLPFGYEAPMWRAVLDQSAVLVALIEDAAEDDLVESEAGALRDMLHPYV